MAIKNNSLDRQRESEGINQHGEEDNAKRFTVKM